MKNNSINDDMIAGYILGDLPDEQIEQLDELAVADPEFFERVGSVENDLVDRYVNGELTEAESAGFASHYLASPLRLEKVNLARAFQEYAARNWGVEGVAAEFAADGSKAAFTDRIAGFFASLGLFGGAQPAFRLAMAAAAVIIVVFGGWVVLRNLTGGRSGDEIVSNISVNKIEPLVQPSPTPELVEVPSNEVPRPSPTPPPTPAPKPSVSPQSRPLIASFVLAAPLRGSNVPSLSIPAAADKAAIRLELESDDFNSYTVELKDGASGRVIWRSGRLSATGKGGVRSLKLSLPAKSLKPAVYTLAVSGLKGGKPEIIGDYAFRVVR